MSKFSASDVAFSGFRLVRENLKTVAIWGVLMTVPRLLASMVTIHFFGRNFRALSEYFAISAKGPDRRRKCAPRWGDLAPLMLWSLPYSLVLYSACCSRGEPAGSAPIRQGFRAPAARLPDELRQAAMLLLVNL
jgi:hypothetical protein